MNEHELIEFKSMVREEVRATLGIDFRAFQQIREHLDIILAKQEQTLDHLMGLGHQQETDYKAHLSSLKGLMADHKKTLEEIRTIYQDAKNDTRELRQLVTKHQHRLSSYYYNFHLKVLGLAALGGFSALVLLYVIKSFLWPVLGKYF